MAECLRTAGHQVQVIELAGRLPDPDQTAIYGARTAWAALPADSVRLIDGLALPAFDGLPLHQVIGLVHHPASLETGVPEETRQRLHVTDTVMFRDLPRIVVTSEQTAELVVGHFGAARDRIGIVIPGADDLPRSTGSAGPGGDSACQILSVGALVPRKGHNLLIRALSRLFDLDWNLTIAGSPDRDPVHANGLAALARELNVARRVHFADDVTEALWSAADFFALTSNFEGYGMAIAEALRRGLPVAVTNVGAVSTLVAPLAGVVCARGDIEQLAKALRRLIFDQSLRREMAETAWQSGQSLPSWDTQAARLAAILSAPILSTPDISTRTITL